jgi:anti-sigma B factor antagonist
MTVSSPTPDNTEVIVPESSIDLYSVPEIRERVAQLIAEGKTNIILDISGTTVAEEAEVFMRGLAEAVRKAGGSLVLVAPDPVVKVFQITGLDQVHPVFSSREAALAALGSAPDAD